MTDGHVLEFSHATKRFGALTAVDDLSARIEPGAVTAFLGPNGAGKTTSLRMLLGQIRPVSGTATIGGVPHSELRHPLRTIGAVLEETLYRPRRTAPRQLTIAARANGIPLTRVPEVLALVGLQNETETRIGAYSLGMRQRLSIAGALLGDPGALVLDEPANGLDPEGIRWMRLLMRRLADEGRTVLVSSHVLSEIEQVADRVLVLSKGRLVYADSIGKLSDPTTGSVIVDATDRGALVAALSASGLGFDVLRSGLTVHNTDAATVGALAVSAGVALTTLQQRGPSLEEVFLDLVHGRRDPMTGAIPIIAGAGAQASSSDVGSGSADAADVADVADPGSGDAEGDAPGGLFGTDGAAPVVAAAGAGVVAAGAAGAGIAGLFGGAEASAEEPAGSPIPTTRRAAAEYAAAEYAAAQSAEASATGEVADGEVAGADENADDENATGEAPSADEPGDATETDPVEADAVGVVEDDAADVVEDDAAEEGAESDGAEGAAEAADEQNESEGSESEDAESWDADPWSDEDEGAEPDGPDASEGEGTESEGEGESDDPDVSGSDASESDGEQDGSDVPETHDDPESVTSQRSDAEATTDEPQESAETPVEDDAAIAAGVALTAPIDAPEDGADAPQGEDDSSTTHEAHDGEALGAFETAALTIPDEARELSFDELITGIPAAITLAGNEEDGDHESDENGDADDDAESNEHDAASDEQGDAEQADEAEHGDAEADEHGAPSAEHGDAEQDDEDEQRSEDEAGEWHSDASEQPVEDAAETRDEADGAEAGEQGDSAEAVAGEGTEDEATAGASGEPTETGDDAHDGEADEEGGEHDAPTDEPSSEDEPRESYELPTEAIHIIDTTPSAPAEPEHDALSFTTPEPSTETTEIAGIEIFAALAEGRTQEIQVILDESHDDDDLAGEDVTQGEVQHDEDPRAAAVSASLAAAARAFFSDDAPSYTPAPAVEPEPAAEHDEDQSEHHHDEHHAHHGN